MHFFIKPIKISMGHAILGIYFYLDFKDFLNCSIVDKLFNQASCYDYIWNEKFLIDFKDSIYSMDKLKQLLGIKNSKKYI